MRVWRERNKKEKMVSSGHQSVGGSELRSDPRIGFEIRAGWVSCLIRGRVAAPFAIILNMFSEIEFANAKRLLSS